MEVDLICADARVSIELDGSQHLVGADAYRHDRRKDQMLQENGYIVLRFLAEDVGQRLDAVLDAILRTPAHRGKRKPDNPSPVASQGANSASPIDPPDPPPRAARSRATCADPLGLAYLRDVLCLSATADVNRVCEDAACELESLREQSPRRPWRE